MDFLKVSDQLLITRVRIDQALIHLKSFSLHERFLHRRHVHCVEAQLGGYLWPWSRRDHKIILVFHTRVCALTFALIHWKIGGTQAGQLREAIYVGSAINATHISADNSIHRVLLTLSSLQ